MVVVGLHLSNNMVAGGKYTDLQWFEGVHTNPPFSRHRLAGSSSEHHHSSPRSEGGSSSSKTSELASDCECDSN